MSQTRQWTLSQAANKDNGVCSVCHVIRQLHIKDGTIHRHGPRGQPCPGSDKPPLHSQKAQPKSINNNESSSQASLAEPQSTKAWTALLHFGSSFLRVPERGGKRRNISSILLKRLKTEPTSADDHPDLPTIHRKSGADSARAAAISTKVEEGNITAAVRILCSDDSPADFSSSNLDRLRGKHPSEHAGARPSANPAEKPALQVSEIAVLKAVRSFPAGSTGGPDGI